MDCIYTSPSLIWPPNALRCEVQGRIGETTCINHDVLVCLWTGVFVCSENDRARHTHTNTDPDQCAQLKC